MKLIGSMKFSLLLMMLFTLIWLASLVPMSTMAQDLPTPTNIGEGNGNGGNGGSGRNRHNGNGGGDSSPVVPGASVSGKVYSYSDKMYVSGVLVVVSGEGWQAEVLTNSDGYYHVGGLGSGRAVVNLRLPPGTTPVVFDWPVWLSSGSATQVDLGYYWNDVSALPVLLSGAQENNLFTLQVQNQSGETLPGSALEITSPPHIVLPPVIQTSQGSVTSYDSHRLRVALGDLSSGAVVTVTMALKTQEVFMTSAEDGDDLGVIFTYSQQKTPLMLEVTANQLVQAPPPAASGGMTAAVSTPVAPPVAASGEMAAAVTSTPPAPLAAAGQAEASAAPTRMAPLPITGQPASPPDMLQLALALLVGLGLSAAGWQAWRKSQIG